jgi:hypothetical protein
LYYGCDDTTFSEKMTETFGAGARWMSKGGVFMNSRSLGIALAMLVGALLATPAFADDKKPDPTKPPPHNGRHHRHHHKHHGEGGEKNGHKDPKPQPKPDPGK